MIADAHLLVGSGKLTFNGWGGRDIRLIDLLHPRADRRVHGRAWRRRAAVATYWDDGHAILA